MTTRIVRDDLSAFRIRRVNGNGFGVPSDVDPLVVPHVKELNELLGKAVFSNASFVVVPEGLPQGRGKRKRGRKANGRGRDGDGRPLSPAGKKVKDFLALPLKAKYAPKKKGAKEWADDSAASFLAQSGEAPEHFSLSDFIDKTPALAQLKYAFLDEIQEDWSDVHANARAVLKEYPFIRDYLLAYAYLVVGIEDADAVKNLILNHKQGTRRIVEYAAVSAARTLIDKEQLKVEDYNNDESAFVDKLEQTPISLSASTFAKTVRALIKEFVFDRDEEDIIEKAIKAGKIGEIPEGVKPLLVKYIQASPVPITEDNAKYYLPNFVLQIMRTQRAPGPDATDVEVPDGDFRVRFEDDDANNAFEVSGPAVECAAQMYHAMVLGDELDVFGAVQYLTNKRLLMNGGMKIKSPILRKDLQDYVFDNEFVDPETGQRMTRTRPAERQMFSRQVFDQGNVPTPEDMPVNFEFPQLWKVLMLESARYLDRAQASLHPDSFVSPQGVAQAVEDLQYNLSTHCTGMATVMAPIVDAELAFVLERILKHPEIIQQVVPEGGTWKRVVDKLNAERRARRGNAATVYNKAREGKEIIDAIANYTPGDFDDFGKLSAFISKVDFFITTQSILQRGKPTAPRGEVEAEERPDQGIPAPMSGERGREAAPEKAAVGADEWDF